MRIALIDSDRDRCGIREHSNMLREYVYRADPTIEFVNDPAWLNPDAYGRWWTQSQALFRQVDVLHLNYHRGLHSQWTPERLAGITTKKVITFHDTMETQTDALPWDLLDVCDAMIVHEPCNLLRHEKVCYWRQGVPEPDPLHTLAAEELVAQGRELRHAQCRPYVGTCGFAFPWKGFELLCDAAASVGWGVLILSHNATDEQVNDWQQRNPWVEVDREYRSTPDMIARLATCDATAFLYQCANTGTSGAIRLGIAAGKPLLATRGCRQFRDLEDTPTGTIKWVAPVAEGILGVSEYLKHLYLCRYDTLVVALREQDSWRHLGKKYAALYRAVVAGTELPA